ncbi:hypothetical protein Ddc_14022 [Ditylenchus destructor]|nr:hypothetical protein Ddc_14022 [Ditylenchus destructor]
MLLYTVILLIAVVNAQLIYDRRAQDVFKSCIEEYTTSSSLAERECESYLASETCLKKAGVSERQAFKYMANERARHPELPLSCSGSTSVGLVWLIAACTALWGFSQLAGQADKANVTQGSCWAWGSSLEAWASR